MKADTQQPRPRASRRVRAQRRRWTPLLAVALVGLVALAALAIVPVAGEEPADEHAELIAQMYEWRNDPQWSHQKAHTDRWDRALLAFGETVADASLTAMTAAEAQALADQDWGTRWVPVAEALWEIEGGVQQAAPNQAPTVSSAIADVTIVNESGTREVALAGVFDDADNDALSVSAASSDEAVATVAAAADGSSLTLTARARGAATITVTADDGNGGTVDDAFSVTVKAAPVVASALSDLSGLAAGSTQEVSLAGVFSDADGDALTISAASWDDAKATVSVASDGSALTVAGVAKGTATIAVTAQDADGNRVADAFDVTVKSRYAALIAQIYEWREDPLWRHQQSHTDRWDRALLAFGETVSDTTLTAMTAAEAQAWADSGLTRWVGVAAALWELEAPQQQAEPPDQAATESQAQQGVQAQQGSAITLVSNLGQTDSGGAFTTSTVLAQGFTTGSNASGYTLTSIEAVLEAALNEAQTGKVSAELWSATLDGAPDTKAADLTVPSTLAAGKNSFTAPENTRLRASTTYFAVFYTSDTTNARLQITSSDDEDSGGAAGWSIGNGDHGKDGNDPTSTLRLWTTTASSLSIAVKGTVNEPDTRRDLSALEVSGSDSASGTFTAVTLNPAFASDTTSYSATVDPSISHLKVTPTLADTTSSVSVAGSDATSGTATLVELTYGANNIFIEIVDADDEDSKSYIVVVTRTKPPLLVGNLGQTYTGSATINMSGGSQGFTTGSATSGYTLTNVELDIRAALNQAARDKVRVELWSDSSGEPDSMLASLTVPGRIAAGTTAFEAPANTTLAADTTYHVVFYTDGDADFLPGFSTSSAEDSGGATGWSIADAYHTAGDQVPTSTSTWTSINIYAFRIAVRGAVNTTSTASSNADLSALTASGSTDGSSFTALSGADALVPAFDSDTTGYRATVGYSTTHVKLTPTVDDTGKATVKVGKAGGTLAPVTDGSASAAIALDVGDNAITVEVTAEDSSTQEYTVTVRRSPADSSWHATIVPVEYTSGGGGFGCFSEATCDSQLTGNDFTVGGTDYAFSGLRDNNTGNRLIAILEPEQEAALQALKFCAGDDAYQIPSSSNLLSTTDVGWADGVPVSLSIGTHCTGTLGTPTGLTAEMASMTSATVSWNRAAGPDTQSYELSWRATGHSMTRSYNDKSGSTITETISGLTSGSSYEFRVRSKAGGGYQASAWTNWVTATTATLPTITLSSDASSDTAAEGDSAVTITATLSEAAPTGGVTVTLAKAGTATDTSDYTLSTSTISITATETTGTASLTIVDDSAVEANETVVLSGTATGHTAGSLTVTIDDNDTAAKPTALVANGGNTKLDVSWTAPAGVLTGYDVHYTSASADDVADTATVRSDNDDTAGWVNASHTGTTASHTIGSLTNDTEYRVRVRGLSAAGDGAWEFATGTPTSSLVSNTEQRTTSSTIGSAATGSASVAQGFETGSNAGGYTLSAIEIQTTDNPTPSQSNRLRVGVWEANAQGVPGTLVHALTKPTNINPGTVVLSAPAEAALQPSTRYFFVLYTQNNYNFTATTIDDDDEDTGGSAGWTIFDGHHTVAANHADDLGSNTWAAASNGQSLLISVKGAEVPSVPVSLSASPNPVTEGSAVTVTATLDAALDADVTIPLTITDGSAGSGDRGTLAGIAITAGNRSGTGEITTADDKVDEDNETFTVALDEANLPSSVSAGTPRSVQITINDNDTRGVTIDQTSRTVEVGETTSYKVKLNSQPTASVTITPTSSDTAKATVSGAMTFTTSNWDQEQTVTITGKAAGTGLKVTHAVTASTDSKYPTSLAIAEVGLTVGASTKTYQITATRTAAEGASASLTVTLGRNAPTGGLAFSVAYDYSGSTATSADTGTTPATVTVAAGSRTATLTVPIAQDALVEGTETFTATITTSVAGWAATGTGNAATITITDDEAANAKIAFHASNAAATAKYTKTHAESASASVPVTINHLPQANTTFTITLLTTGSNRATEYTDPDNPGAGDFYIMTKSVTFGPTTTKTQSLSITFNDDDLVEWGEIIPLSIADSASGLGAHYMRSAQSKLATVTIQDNERAKIAFGSDPDETARITEEVRENLATYDLDVSIDHLPQVATTFEIDVIATGLGAGTATEYTDPDNPGNGDFYIETKSVTFGPNDTAEADGSYKKNLTITIRNDDLVENDQTIGLRLKAADSTADDLGDFYMRAAGIASSISATVTIEDDEAKVAEAAFGGSAGAEAKLTVDVDEEVAAGSVKVPITISALPEVETEFQVSVLAASTALEYTDTANPGNGDFYIATKKVTFDADDTELTKNVTVTIRNDALLENEQTIELEIHQGTGFFTKYGRDANGKLAAVTIDDETDRDQAKIAFGDKADRTAKLTPSEDEDVATGKLNVPITVSALPDTDTTFTVEVLTTGTASEWQSATDKGDFRVNPKTVTFGPGTAKIVYLAISIEDDDLVELDQTIDLRLAAVDPMPGTDGAYADLGDYYERDDNGKLATVKIVDEDRGEAKIAFGAKADAMAALTADVDEEIASGKRDLAVTISHLPEEDTTFTVSVLAASTASEYTDSATPGRDDFHIATKTLTFRSTGSETQNLTITVNNDDVVENDQTVQLAIAAADDPANDLGDYYVRHTNGSKATVTIEDDDRDEAKVAMSLSNASEVKLEASAAEDEVSFIVPVSISHRAQEGISFTLEVTGGSARETDDPDNPTGNPKDYVIASKTVTFPALNRATKYVTVTIEDDRVEEDTETIDVRIKPAAASPGTVGAYGDLGDYYTRHAEGSTGTLTITDNDEVASVALSINVTATGSPDAPLYQVVEGSLVTVTATADIPVGPRGWQVTAENYEVTEGRWAMQILGQCGDPPYNYNVFACPNDYTLPPTFTIEEGQTTATGTLRINTDPSGRDGGREERLTLRAKAVRDTDGDGSTADETTLTTVQKPEEGLNLRINDSAVGVTVGALVSSLVPGETATYTVNLRGKAPTSDVTVTPTSGATDKATVSCATDPCALTFTADDWDQPQEITVTAVAAGSATITHAVSSDDTTYGSLGSTGTVLVTVEAGVKNYRIQGSATAKEGESAELTVTLGDIAPTGGLAFSVAYDYSGSTATSADTGTTPSTVTVGAGSRTATLTVPIASDELVDGTETFTATISTSVSGWSARATGENAATITIADATEARVWFGAAGGAPATLYQASVGEGAGTLSVPVTVDKLPKAATTFDIEVVGSGSATEGAAADFTIATKSVTFRSSDSDSATTKNLTVAINEDAVAEGAEEIKLRIANPDRPADDLGDHYRRGSGSVGRSQATLTIADNDGSVVVSESAVAVTKNGAVKYAVRLVGAAPGGAVVVAVTSGDTDVATVSPATLSFTAANQPQEVTVTGKAAGTATVSHAISTERTAYPTTLTIGSVDVTVTEQPTASLAVSPNPVPEGTSVTVTLTLSKRLDVTMKTIPIVLTAGTADTGDYGSLANIAVNNTGTVFRGTITTVDDADTEDETFTVALGALPSSVTRGTPDSVEVTIQDGDTNTVSLSASSSTVGEGETVTITATLTQPLSNAIVIPLTITSGTAGDADYTVPALKQIRIAAGERSGTFEIETVEDQDDEPDETFTVALGSPLPEEVVAGTRSVTVTIDDGDPNRVSLSAAPSTVEEGRAVTITATLERALSNSVVIPFTIMNGTATDADYTAPALAQITIAATETSGTIEITAVQDDDASEGDETFTVALGSPLPDGVQAGASSVEVTIRDGDRTPQPPTRRGPTNGGGGGGGGGAPRTPTPSEADFDWNVSRDIESLDRDNEAPTGLWSDGETLYVLDNAGSGGDRVYAYRLDTGERREASDTELERRNRFAHGLWSDGELVWVADTGQDRLFAYELESGERLEERDLDLAERNRDPRGIWSDGSRFLVLDSGKDALFLYDFEAGELLAELPLDKLNKSPRGIWSDGVTIWVSDDGAKRIFAYRLVEEEIEAQLEPDAGSAPVPPAETDPESAQAPGSDPETDPEPEIDPEPETDPEPEIDPEPEDAQDADGDQPDSEAAAPVEIRYELVRHEAEEFTFSSLLKAGNGDPRGIWSDGRVMYVADARDSRVYSYNLPAAIDARLASVTLNEVALDDFSPRELSYAIEVEHDVELATVAATPAREGATVVIEPADADDDPENGHQLAVEDGVEVVVTVSSEDGSRMRIYTLTLQRANRAPVASEGPVVELTAGGEPAIVNLDDYFSDPDGDRLSFTVGGSSDDGVATVEAAGAMLRITPQGAGAASFEVTASDGELENEPRTIAITVEPAAAPVETPEEPAVEVGPEVRLAARPVAAGSVEFGLQERGEDGAWQERLLPRARFLPSDSEVDRWRVSSRIVVGEGEAARTVVIAARRIASGAVEFALVIRRADDSGWSARLLPRARILRPDSESDRWRYSTPLVLGSP